MAEKKLMSREEMMLRLGYYSGLAARLLQDYSYAERFLGWAHLITEETYTEVSCEIQKRLVVAGFLHPDEDAYETRL